MDNSESALAIESDSHNMTKTISRFVRRHQGITGMETEAWAEELQDLVEADARFFRLNRFLFRAEKR